MEDIGFSLDTESGIPFYRQIVRTVEHYTRSGTLKPGDKLPTIRALSVALKINPNTIAKAYMELEIRGLVHTQVGSGTYVSAKKANAASERERGRKKAEELCWGIIRKAKSHSLSKGQVLQMLKSLWEE
jgi:GntR family transcriptional regulator